MLDVFFVKDFKISNFKNIDLSGNFDVEQKIINKAAFVRLVFFRTLTI